MIGTQQVYTALEQAYVNTLQPLYPGRERGQVLARWKALAAGFTDRFGGHDTLGFFSAPGRTEIGGNHTDHQNGCVVTASVDADAIACAAPNGGSAIRLFSQGHGGYTINLSQTEPDPTEFGKTEGLVRGVAARLLQLGCPVGGLDAYVQSDVLPGSGLSSSAAFEVLVALIINSLFCGGALPPEELAKAGQYAENVYFGKPCGLQDQMASAVGGLLSIDFGDPQKPLARPLPGALDGYALYIIDSGGGHANLTGEYAAIPAEMGCAAGCFGQKTMRPVTMARLLDGLEGVRERCGDRAALRALHFIRENERALSQANALTEGRTEDFLALVRASGASSWTRLQNVYPAGAAQEQPVAVALAVCEELLGGAGACRVHGGGFAGTVQAFVPLEMAEAFRNEYEHIMGADACHRMYIRPAGGITVL